MKTCFLSMREVDYPDLDGLRVAVVSPDDKYRKKIFSLGKAYAAEAFRRCNAKVSVISCDVGAYEDHEFVECVRQSKASIFALGGMFPMIREIERLILLIRAVVPDATILLAGPVASPTPEFILRKTGADFALVGETEITIPLLMRAIAEGKEPGDVPGVAFFREEVFVHTGEPICLRDISLAELGLPAVDLFPLENYIIGAKHPPFALQDRMMSIVTGRGCPFNCNFCYRVCKFRTRSASDICDEIEYYVDRYSVDGFYFLDDLVMVSKKRVESLCNEIMNRKLRIKFNCSGRVDVVTPDVVRVLKEAGCVSVFYGIESGDQNALDTMHKKTTVAQCVEAVRITREAGLFCAYGIMFGQPGEDRESLRNTVKLVKDISYGDCPARSIAGCIPFPGTELYNWCKQTGRITSDQDFYDKFICQDHSLAQLPINMTSLSDDDARAALAGANAELAVFFRTHLFR